MNSEYAALLTKGNAGMGYRSANMGNGVFAMGIKNLEMRSVTMEKMMTVMDKLMKNASVAKEIDNPVKVIPKASAIPVIVSV